MEAEEKGTIGNVKKYYENSFDGFLARLQEHSIATSTKYVLNTSSKDFNKKEVSPTINQRIYWDDDVPYYHFGLRRYDCHQGKDRNVNKKRKYAEERDRKALDDHSFIKRYQLTKPTKKLDCPATVNVYKWLRMPQFKLSGSLSRHYERVQQTKIIRRKLEEGDLMGEEVFVFNLPGIEIHKNHFVGDCAFVTVPEPEVTLPLSGDNRLHLINECSAVLKLLQSTLWNLGEEDLKSLKRELTTTYNVFCEKTMG